MLKSCVAISWIYKKVYYIIIRKIYNILKVNGVQNNIELHWVSILWTKTLQNVFGVPQMKSLEWNKGQ